MPDNTPLNTIVLEDPDGRGFRVSGTNVWFETIIAAVRECSDEEDIFHRYPSIARDHLRQVINLCKTDEASRYFESRRLRTQ